VRTLLQEFLQEKPYELIEVAVTKMGRAHFVVTYIKPEDPVSGETADELWQELDNALRDKLGQAKTEVIIAAQPPYRT
jgi:hypothetical protein